jgi:Ca-activated chloride channel family protein
MTIELTRPDALLLLALLPVWALLVWPWAGRGVLYTRGAPGARRSGWPDARATLILFGPRLLTALALAALIIGLAGPELVEPDEETVLEGGSIGLVVDLSSSMLAEDMGDERSRLSVAREAAVRFARRRVYDELSLVGFASDAVTRVPPTTDADLIEQGVESLEIQLVRDGTDISGAVLAAIERLRGSEREPRVVVLLTDGAHNGADLPPLAAARVAEVFGIRIHAISVVSNNEDPRSLAPGIVRERFGIERETVLQQLAGITGGRYFRAVSATALDSIYDEIDRIETPVPRQIPTETRVPLRAWFFIAGLGVLGMEGLLRGSRWGVVH